MNSNGWEALIEGVLLPVAVLVIGLLVVLRMLMGKKAFAIFVGQWVFELSRLIFLAPFRVVVWVVKIIIEAYVRYKSDIVAAGSSFVSFLKQLISGKSVP